MKLFNNFFKILSGKLYLLNHALILCRLGSKGNKKSFITLTLIILLTGFTESLPVFIALPFLTIISEPEKVLDLPFTKSIINLLKLSEPNQLLLPCLVFFIVFIIINCFLRVYLTDYIFFIKASIANNLTKSAFKKVLFSTYEFHIETNSSIILNDFNNSMGCSIAYIETFLSIIRDLVLMLFIVFTLTLVDAKITLIVFFIAGFSYILSFINKNIFLTKVGRISKITSERSTNAIQDGLGSIKNIILENSQNLYIKKFDYYNRKYLFSNAKISAALTKPKYLIEGFFFSGIVIIAYILKVNLDINPIPILGALALGLQKLLPIVNNLFVNYSSMVSRYEQSNNTIELIQNTPQDLKLFQAYKLEKLNFKVLELKNLNYKYPSSKKVVIEDCNLEISRGDTIGIKGKTGEGKSTLINLIMGLIKPSKGEIKVNGTDINDAKEEIKLIQWRKSIAHVPQFIFISDISIIENIAFGEKIKDINFDKLVFCCKAAQIWDFIEMSEKGLYTKVGERGIKLSGGQIQRMGIARALYRDAEILILDEATSALDQKTESKVIESIRSYKNNLTVIAISHRLSTLSGYDRILRFHNKTIHND